MTDVANPTTAASTGTLSQERQDWLDTLRTHRNFLRTTARDLTDEQATTRSTVSALTVAGIIKHVAQGERQWARFAVEGASAFDGEPWVGLDWEGFAALYAAGENVAEDYENGFQLEDGETLASVLAEYEAVAAATDALVATLDLDTVHPLPIAPWHEPGSAWSVRRVLAHIVAETAQHAGHADIIRESIDGAKTMG